MVALDLRTSSRLPLSWTLPPSEVRRRERREGRREGGRRRESESEGDTCESPSRLFGAEDRSGRGGCCGEGGGSSLSWQRATNDLSEGTDSSSTRNEEGEQCPLLVAFGTIAAAHPYALLYALLCGSALWSCIIVCAVLTFFSLRRY